MLTASGTPRGLRCVASLVLPRHRFESAYADAGSGNHEDIEAAIDVGDESAIPDAVLDVINEGDETITERAFAYDVVTDTARVLPPGKHKRDYSNLGPFEIPGTPDLIIRGARVTVVDHKKFEEVDAADRNAQAATYALMVARAFGLDEIDIMIHYVEAEWRRPSTATLGPLDLDAHAAKLKQLQLDAAKARENPLAWVNAGTWCKYCDCQLECPAWTALRKQVATGELALTTEARIPFEDDNEAADAFEILQRLKTMTARLTAALYARAKERPIPLPDGNVLAYVPKEGKRKIDGDKAYALIKEKFGTAVADDSVKRALVQKMFKEALGKHGIRGADAKNKALIEQLDKQGAVTRETKLSPEVVPAIRLLKESA